MAGVSPVTATIQRFVCGGRGGEMLVDPCSLNQRPPSPVDVEFAGRCWCPLSGPLSPLPLSRAFWRYP